MKRKPDNDPRSACQGKMPYPSFRAAARVANRIKHQGSGYKPGPYHCPHCHYVHLGHTDRVTPRNRQFREARLDQDHDVSL